MSRFAHLLQPDQGQEARTLALVHKDQLEDWLKALPERARVAARAADFTAKAGEIVILPGDKPDDWSAAMGVPAPLGIWDLAKAAQSLPEAAYRLADASPGLAGLGWMLAQYRFDRYRADAKPMGDRVLLTREPGLVAEQARIAEATALVRDMVNTPAADFGPSELQAAVEALAEEFDAKARVTRGDDLAQGFPMIHAVGQAADRDRAPRLIELEWGNPANPRIAVIGKGVAFDTGGLNIKTGSFMRLMKKDMGGAAHALALARLVMEARLPVRLHLLIPAVENAISGTALRPGDILKSRKGLFVEIDNTDAEGRLILGDALARAGEDAPQMILDFATLTGAARVALGPDLPALFSNDDALATELLAASEAVQDPSWRMPLWDRYQDMLRSDIADVVNSAEGGMAGCITAALFLERFVDKATPWAHFDTFAWRPSARAGQPKGGEAMGLRAAFEMLKRRFSVA
ncbi:MAG: leucyl aminopeptidase family protein [Chakrabartia sp.]